MNYFYLYGIKFMKTDARHAAKKLTNALCSKHEQSTVFTPNFNILMHSRCDFRLRKLLKGADILLPDGMGVSLLCRAHMLPGVPRITGIDMGFFLLRYAAQHGIRVFFLGGAQGVAEKAAKRLRTLIPKLKICGAHHGYFDKAATSDENRRLIEKINSSRAELLFVCLGFPLQEAWIAHNIHSLPHVRLAMGLGGSLDVWSGKVHRAPLCFRVLGIEWLWRIMQSKKAGLLHSPENTRTSK